MKKKKLESSFEVDFDLYGLVSNSKEYKLAWNINKALGISLLKKDDIKIEFSDHSSILISYYLYDVEHTKIELLHNRLVAGGARQSKYLIPELGQFDYLLKIRDASESFLSEIVTDNIKEIPVVEYVMKVNFETLKSKENLLY